MPGAGDVYELKVKGYCAADPFENVFHYKVTVGGADEVTTAKSLCLAWKAAVLPSILAAMPDAATWRDSRCQKVLPTRGVPVTDGINQVGELSEDYLPIEDAMLFRMQTAQPGRQGYGHKYLSPVVESLASGDNLDVLNALVVAIGSALKNTITNGGNTFAPVIVKVPGGTPYSVVTADPVSKVSHQRRRKARF